MTLKKKKGLCLGLLAALLGIGNIMQAYKLTIKNETKYIIEFKVKYHGEFFISCMPDTKKLASGDSTKLSSGACTVKEVTALVYLLLKNRLLKRVVAKPYKASLGRAGNTTFVVSKDGSGFRVTRVKYRSRFKS